MIGVVGESLVDFIQMGPTDFFAALGGAPANVSVALSRQGIPVSYVGRVARDALGIRLRARLESNGVNLENVVDADENSSVAIVTVDQGGTPAYSFYLEGTSDWQWREGELPKRIGDQVAALHIGSLALAIEPGASVLARWITSVREHGTALISYDPNVRPGMRASQQAERARVECYSALAQLVKTSEEDLAFCYPGIGSDEVARHLLDLGAQLVVVTRGANGADAYRSNGRTVAIPAVGVPVVDTVGAGDAFCAGLLASFAENGTLDQSPECCLDQMSEDMLMKSLERAALVAALTCTRQGADPPDPPEIADAAVNRSTTRQGDRP